jgi:2-oxoacid:acceptor oxidoreductase delta subunit (pyruvate/2-ketoisovalerate family)
MSAITQSVGSSLATRSGSRRTSRPVYVDRLPPCNDACPAGEDIQGWLAYAEGGDYEAAWRALTATNPLPATMGRVCSRPCEGACNRGRQDEAVGIGSVERFLGDEAIRRSWAFARPPKESGKSVLVVGAGPSGLSAAHHLRRRGHRVSIAEAGPLAGGPMRVGDPESRLPRDILDAEVQRILDTGVEMTLNRPVANLRETMRAGKFDAAFLAVGTDMTPDSPGIFADDDTVPSERTVTVGVGHGRKAARHIDAWLRGGTYEQAAKRELAAFEHLNLWYYGDAPEAVRPLLDAVRRKSAFGVPVTGLDETTALFEARRCLSCGNCFECDNCYGVCPDNAVIKLGPGKRFEFDYDYCKGCGICVAECPCGAIRMTPETL